MQRIFLSFILIIAVQAAEAQQVSLLPIPQGKASPHLNLVFNRIVNGNLDGFYKKLSALKKGDSTIVNIIHIGDSHIQPDFVSSVVRKGLQDFFGNAGRGFVFPHALAKSNGAMDVVSSSNIAWRYNRLAHPEIPVTPGIAGHVIETDRPLARINFSLKKDGSHENVFNKLKFFLDTAYNSSWQFETPAATMPVMITNKETGKNFFKELQLDHPASSFSLTSHSAGDWQSFYGVELENGLPGVLLHTIGVNGARYDHYNDQPLFWQQLHGLKADLVIVSLGTNEAQAAAFNAEAFTAQVQRFTDSIRALFPEASLLITTPQDSYKGRRSNEVMRSLNFMLSAYCQQHNIALWDLYKVTNGYGSARNWVRLGLMNRDRIHFTVPAYNLQGKLLFNALARGYNDYITVHQNFK